MKKILMISSLFLMSSTLYATASTQVEGGINPLNVVEYLNNTPVPNMNVININFSKLNDPEPFDGSLDVSPPTYRFFVDRPLENATYQITNLNMRTNISDGCYYNLIFDVNGAIISKVRAAASTDVSPACDVSRLDFTVLSDGIKVNYTS